MLVHQAFRYELDPTAAEQAALANHASAARWAWNWGLSVRRKAWQRRGETLNAMALHRLLNRLKRTPRYGWLYELSKCAPQEALRDLDRAYANYWRGRNTARQVGRPRFKKRGRCLARAISDQAWGEFHRQLVYKTAWRGSRLLVAPRFYASSKRCSRCGFIKVTLPLGMRVFECEACGLVIDRDINAARNLVQLAEVNEGLVAASSAETLNACGGESAGAADQGGVKLPPAKQERARIPELMRDV